MSRMNWSICEQSGKWAAALRVALGRSNWPRSSIPRLFETRQLGELATQLNTRPDDMAFVEVHRANAYDALVWLAAASRIFHQARFVALVDREYSEPFENVAATQRQDSQSLADALREAGASEVVTSPRQLQGILELGRRQISLRAERIDGSAFQMPIAEWAWASLPWQAE